MDVIYENIACDRASKSLASITKIKVSVIELRNLNYFFSALLFKEVAVKTNI